MAFASLKRQGRIALQLAIAVLQGPYGAFQVYLYLRRHATDIVPQRIEVALKSFLVVAHCCSFTRNCRL